MLYPPEAADLLDFQAVKDLAAEHAATRKGRLRLRDAVPTADRAAMEPELLQVDELLRLMERGHFFPAVAAAEVDDALPMLRIEGAVLTSEQCLAILAQAQAYANAYRFVLTHAEFAPTLEALARPFPPEDEVPRLIEGVFERNGLVRSNASPELARIRADLAKARVAADKLFYKVLRRYEAEGWLGDIRESVSNDRRVLALSSSHKNKARGAFHGSSAKNSLVYLEPSECLEVNAEVGLLIEDERKEVRRILKALTKALRPHREVIARVDERLTDWDSLAARARFARAEGGVLPQWSDEVIYVEQGVNPVLRKVQREKGRGVVPLNVRLDPDHRLLLISGPNAGGKSLALKTVGLFQLMLQSGFLVPAHPRTTMRWFARVMADIGDAQSVENELSTYSGKLSKMREILAWCDPETLVLVDEFGSGSDPDLGAALAGVFLREIHQSGATGIFTTHYNSIKALAEELDAAQNANMAFDVQSFEPRYTLELGSPGSSYTFEVAQRVGIPKRLMSEARAALNEQTHHVDRLLVGLQKQRSALDRARNELDQRLKDLEALKADQSKRIAKLEDKLAKAAEANASGTDRLMWGKRLEQLSASWAKAKSKKAKDEVIERATKLFAERNGVEKKASQRKETAKQIEARQKLEAALAMPVKIGDKVKIVGGGRQQGEVLEVRRDKFLVRLGGVLSTWVERKQFVHWGVDL
jgi:DNA mismatch repair protein MutS2